MPVICFMLFGCLIYLWNESKVMGSGHCSALMRRQVWLTAGVKNLKSFTPNMRKG